MTIHRFLPHRWRSRAEAAAHARAIAAVLDTPPIAARHDGLVLFSMIGTAVLLPYLVAVKSLWSHLRRGRVALLDDGTLTAEDLALLAHHCDDPEIIRIAAVDTGGFPRGGCWERFLTILDRRAGEYWLQLDSDTVTVGAVDEVADAVAANRSFTLLGGADAELGTLSFAEFAHARHPGGPADGHVQHRIETRLGLLPDANEWRYVRGCAGFAGFAAGGPGRERARMLLAAMESLVGSDIVQWGTEQVASNLHIANEADPVLLPYARYLNYWGEPWAGDAAFVHFVGTHRHGNGAYRAASLRAIDALRPAVHPSARQAMR